MVFGAQNMFLKNALQNGELRWLKLNSNSMFIVDIFIVDTFKLILLSSLSHSS